MLYTTHLVTEFLFTITSLKFVSIWPNVLHWLSHVGWWLLTDALTCWLVCWVDMLVDVYWLMHCHIGCCVGSTCLLTFTDWCIDLLVGVLDRHVGWRLLTDALMCRLVCWVDIFVDVYWLMPCRVGWFVGSTG